MSDVKTSRSVKNEILTNLRKSVTYHQYVVDYVDWHINDIRERYENTAPANETLRGQLTILKSLKAELGAK